MAPTDPFDFSDFGGSVPGNPTSGRLAGSPQSQPHSIPRPVDGSFDPFADHIAPGRQSTHSDVFEDAAGSPIRALTVAGPPVTLFAAAFVTALTGVILGVAAITGDTTVVLAFAGWLLAGPAAIGVLAWFSGVDTRRRLSSVYSAPTWLSTAYWAVLATCAVGIGLGAWQLALWAGRR
ncbi:hypothetical protein M2272_002927 [Mycobacterium frederiksbergense]|uniref:Uncharacterized protein n=1 Tax=Mycolicibacterium frederiksbergense TaxID=117567 RepID=A0ABT6L020_9MYCO|nr:hypothetical protein [Mycolicibacterium frederiksbergense]MDH6196284.1 hypothetical protein [Mycolicibacterium frederiksbergense]